MTHRLDETPGPPANEDDERLGEAIEEYLAMAERGQAPDPDEFAARYPEFGEDIRSALEGLELVHGLVGRGSGAGGASGGPGRPLESGRRIAGYRIVRELGRGGMGTVYEAVHVGLDRPVALKVLGMHAAPDSSARRRFQNEARTAAGLHHTHIVPVFDVGQMGGLCYYAMQKIDGSGLDRVVRHLRRTRGGMNGSGSTMRAAGSSPQENLSGSQFNSRFNRLWVKVSSGIRWARPTRGEVPGAPQSAGFLAIVEKAPPTSDRIGPGPRTLTGPLATGTAPLGRPPLGDSTASWRASASRIERGGVAESRGGLAASCSAVGPRGEPDDQPPPFEPPRGSAYCRWVAELGLQAAEALAHAHHQGVIHRDVKPSNLLIDCQGTVWVTDFGLARRLADPGLTHHDSLLGTPRYMSPEQARTGVIDGRTDVYSLGATLYELLTLRPPFNGQSAAELLDQIGGCDPLPLRAIDRKIPRDLETIVLKSLAKRPGDRYASAAALAEDLARFLNLEPVRARRISPVGRFLRVARRHPGITAVTTVAASLVLSIATYAYLRISHERDLAVKALLKTEAAEQETRAAMRKQLLSHASVVRLSSAPDRRAIGLSTLEQAVSLEPDEELKARLRDEAVEFLVLPEISPPGEFATGPLRGLAFSPDADHLATLSADGEALSFWDVDPRRKVLTIPLHEGVSATESGARDLIVPGTARERNEADTGFRPTPSGRAVGGNGGNGGGGSGGGRRNWYLGEQIAVAGGNVAVILPGSPVIRVLDSLTGTLLRDIARPGRQVLAVIGEPSGKRLVTVEFESDRATTARDSSSPSEEPSGPRGEIQVLLWDLGRADGQPVTLVRSRGEGRQRPASPLVAFAPDGKALAIASRGASSVELFSAEDGSPVRKVETQAAIGALALGVGDLLATATAASVQLWDVDGGAQGARFLNSLATNQSNVRLLRFNAQGTLLAVAGFGPQVELWDPAAHKMLATLKSSDPVADLAFAPDGRTLAVGGRTTNTSVYKVTESAARVELSGFESRPTSLAFAPDGSLAIGDFGGKVWAWRSPRQPDSCARPPRCLSSLPDPEPETPGAESAWRATAAPGTPTPGSTSSAAGSHAVAIEPGASGPRPPAGPGNAPDRAGRRERSWNRGASLAYDSRGRLLAHDGQGLRIWPPRAGESDIARLLELPPIGGPPGRNPPLSRNADGTTMVVVRSSSVYLWSDARTDQLRPVRLPVDSPSEAPAPGPDEAAGPSRGPGGNRRDGRDRFSAGPANRYHSVRIAPGGDRLYLIDDTMTLQVWDLNPGDDVVGARRVTLPESLSGGVTSMALAPDGRLLALGQRNGKVLLIDTARLSPAGRMTPDEGEAEGFIPSLAFAPGGKTLAVGSRHGVISLWTVADLANPALLYRLPGQGEIITSLAFDQRGRRLASSGTEPLVDIWDLDYLRRELERLGLAQ